MEFHLLYSGPLHSGDSETSRREKHAIRKVIHTQLRTLWDSHKNLIDWAIMAGVGAHSEEAQEKLRQGLVPPSPDIPEEEAIIKGKAALARNWNRGGFNFLPLVQREFCLRCSLDILFLRTDELPFVIHDGGDIDGRLKILFDGLRMADSERELPPRTEPEDGENPFYVLLRDDKLISEVRVNTDRLLKLPDSRPPNQHDVYLQITVKLNPTIKTAHSWIFE